MKKKISLTNILVVISLIILILAIVFTFFAKKQREELYIFGYKPYIIVTGSMEPNYQTNSFVMVKKGAYDEVKIGDVVAFKATSIQGQMAFHRVVEITEEGFITKGDNNSEMDGQVIVGKEVFHSNITKFIIEKPIYLILGIIVIVALIIALKILFGNQTVKSAKGKRYKKKR